VAQDGEVGKEAQMGLPAARTRCSGPGGGWWCWSACVPRHGGTQVDLRP
jgi:hypothetical protein